MTQLSLIEERIKESIKTKQALLDSPELLDLIGQTASLVSETLKGGGKILLCGNGGSASDALHIAGELVGRFQRERRALPAISLNADIATLTAVANDYGYDRVFERGVEGLMKRTDTLIGISTSGNSENVYLAIKKAKEIGGRTVAFLGRDGGKIKDIADIAVVVPGECTARIQETHIMIGHIVCEIAEETYVSGQKKSRIS